MTDFEVSYELNMADLLEYNKYLLDHDENPSITDAISRYRRLMFVVAVVIAPLIYMSITRSWLDIVVFFVFMVILFLVFNLNIKKVWWWSYRKKLKKDFTKMVFNGDEKGSVERKVTISEGKITVTAQMDTATHDVSAIKKVDQSDYLLIILLEQYRGTVIPLNRLTKEEIAEFKKLAK